MSEQKTCPDCGEELVRYQRGPGQPWGDIYKHTQGGLACLKRQNSQLREKNERLRKPLVRYGKADLASENAYVHGREAEAALEEENEAAFHALTELARELAGPTAEAAAQPEGEQP